MKSPIRIENPSPPKQREQSYPNNSLEGKDNEKKRARKENKREVKNIQDEHPKKRKKLSNTDFNDLVENLKRKGINFKDMYSFCGINEYYFKKYRDGNGGTDAQECLEKLKTHFAS